MLNARKHQGDADTSVAALVFGSVGNFLVMFLGSALIGILFALVTALVSDIQATDAVNVYAYTCM